MPDGEFRYRVATDWGGRFLGPGGVHEQARGFVVLVGRGSTRRRTNMALREHRFQNCVLGSSWVTSLIHFQSSATIQISSPDTFPNIDFTACFVLALCDSFESPRPREQEDIRLGPVRLVVAAVSRLEDFATG